MRIPLAIAALACTLCSCGDLPQREVGFESPDPAGRVDALIAAAADHDPRAVPELIRMLRSDDPAQRMLANRALIDITGEDFGFDHAAPEAERLAACARWEDWARSALPDADSGSRPVPTASAATIPPAESRR